jgi:hypothetical protein
MHSRRLTRGSRRSHLVAPLSETSHESHRWRSHQSQRGRHRGTQSLLWTAVILYPVCARWRSPCRSGPYCWSSPSSSSWSSQAQGRIEVEGIRSDGLPGVGKGSFIV